LLGVGAAACGGPDGSSTPRDAHGTDGATSDATIGSAGAGAASLDRIGGLELQVSSYAVPDRLEGEGGAQLAAMLEALDLRPQDVLLEVAIDPERRLDIGRWQLPDRDAEEILAAWGQAVGGAWTEESLAGQDALRGRGTDGSHVWVSARDGLFLYIITDDRALAEAAVASD
jgi:hypothetical protein